MGYEFPDIKLEMDEKIREVTGFLPSWDTCYDPPKYINNKCNECEWKEWVYCKNSKNYDAVMKEMK